MQEWMTLSHFVLLGKNFDVSLAYGTRKIILNRSGGGVAPTHVVNNYKGGRTTELAPLRHMGELDPRRSPTVQLLDLLIFPPPLR